MVIKSIIISLSSSSSASSSFLNLINLNDLVLSSRFSFVITKISRID